MSSTISRRKKYLWKVLLFPSLYQVGIYESKQINIIKSSVSQQTIHHLSFGISLHVAGEKFVFYLEFYIITGLINSSLSAYVGLYLKYSFELCLIFFINFSIQVMFSFRVEFTIIIILLLFFYTKEFVIYLVILKINKNSSFHRFAIFW